MVYRLYMWISRKWWARSRQLERWAVCAWAADEHARGKYCRRAMKAVIIARKWEERARKRWVM